MSLRTLLASVLAPEGWYCIVGLRKNGAPKQLFVQTIEEAEQEAANLDSKDYDVYFACAKYESNKSRSTDNVKAIQALWLDIDCGENKPYADQAAGLTALREFCIALNLPKPTIVNSGRGLHVYWPFTGAVARQEWKPLAERLKALCVEKGLQADPSRTADAASILRAPGSRNFKDIPPSPVQIWNEGAATDVETLRVALGVMLASAPDFTDVKLNDLTMSLMGNKQHRFSHIVDKIVAGEGCAQIAKAIAEQATLEEPLWRAALSVARHCVDGDTAIHKLSRKHPDYDAQATEEKAAKTKGPYTCEVFAKINPTGCDNCPHKGKITSPIVLGQEILEAEPDEPVVAFTEVEGDADAPQSVEYKVPTYPFPYFRGKVGGVYRRTGDEDNPDAILIYEHDLYVVKRLRDPQSGEVVWLRLHTPRDGVREFALPAVDLLTPDKLREKLAWFGVVALKKQMDAIMAYIVTFVKELQCKEKAEIMQTQFGWTKNNKSFIVGDCEITATGERYSPPSSFTTGIADYFTPVGELEEWKKVINTYAAKGMEQHAFGFFTAFGAPLMKHMNLKGAMINMISNESGTGKTTVIKAMNSVFGHPEELMLIERDTLNAKLHRLGVMNNLAVGCDEITKMAANDASDWAYAVSQGRARSRMKSAENAERMNFSRWQTIVLCTSNASVVDKLRSLKATPDGELMRVIEYDVPSKSTMSKADADEIFPLLYTNYGMAGRIYMQDIVSNLEERMREVREMQMLLDKRMNFTNRERFWSGDIACNLAGALFAKRLGLHDIDVGGVFRWAVAEFASMQKDIKPPTDDFVGVVGEYWLENKLNTLVINGQADLRTGVEMLPILEPRGELIIRIEPDTKHLYIIARKFRSYCADRQLTVREVLAHLEKERIYIGTTKKRMAKGTKLSAVPPVDAYVFDCSQGDFLDVDSFVAGVKEEADKQTQEAAEAPENAS